MGPWLICAHSSPGSEGSVRCADELEGGLGCTAGPGGKSSRTGCDSRCLAPVCCAGEQGLPSGLARGLGLGQPGRRQDDAHETWLEGVCESSVGFCLVGSAHSHLQTCKAEGCISQS